MATFLIDSAFEYGILRCNLAIIELSRSKDTTLNSPAVWLNEEQVRAQLNKEAAGGNQIALIQLQRINLIGFGVWVQYMVAQKNFKATPGAAQLQN